MTPPPPVIVITGSGNIEIREKALQMGACDYVIKPVDPNDLIPRVRKITG